MATKTAEPAAETSAPSGGLFSTKLLLIAGLVVLFLVAQVGIICYFFLPSAAPAETSASAKEPAAKVAAKGEDDGAEVAEVPIGGAFRCTNSKAAANSVIHVDLKLLALVAGREKTSFEEQLKLHDGRIRQAIIEVARSSSLENLNDPNLSTIKRLIKEKINKVLGKSYVMEVVISDFTTMEQ